MPKVDQMSTTAPEGKKLDKEIEEGYDAFDMQILDIHHSLQAARR